jgi:hypothetical protein
LKRLLVLALALIVLCTAQVHAAPPQKIVVGLDLSRSNILVSSDEFAAKAADRVRATLLSLPARSVVSLRTFGNYDFRSNVMTRDWIVGVKTTKALYIAEEVHQIIRSVPADIRSGKLFAQDTTNIVGFLRNVAGVTQCSTMSTSVILVSDGVEDSSVANMARGSRILPHPASPIFQGCDNLIILGLGQKLRSPQQTERLRREWMDWARAAGFRNFVGLNDW